MRFCRKTQLIEQSRPNQSTQPLLENCIEPFIAALPKEQAQLLRAIELEGQSQKEYAAKNNIAYSTLKSRVQKARQQLRDLFTECCHFSFDHFGGVVDYEPKLKCSEIC